MSPRIAFYAVLLVAFAARMGAMLCLDTPSIADGKTAWDWGWEPTALAQSILDGGSYGNPFGKESGPSSWLTPVYPSVVALCFWIFDGVNAASATAIFIVQSALSALACALLRPFGKHLELPRAGNLASWLLALHPSAIWYAVGRAWDSTFVAAGLMLFLVPLLGMGRNPTLKHTGWIGAAYGVLLFVNPAPLALLPIVLVYLLFLGPERRLARVAVFVGSATLICSPWLIRNYTVLDALGLRSNFGVEMRVGNNDLADGRFAVEYHPSESAREFERYVQLGEAAYSSKVFGESLDWIQSNPKRFGELCLRRAQLFWIGEVPSSDKRSSGELVAKNDPQAWAKWLTNLITGGLSLLALVAFLIRVPKTPSRFVLIGTVVLFPCVYYLTTCARLRAVPLPDRTTTRVSDRVEPAKAYGLAGHSTRQPQSPVTNEPFPHPR